MSGPLRLPAAVRRAIAAHARRDAPNECCGFLLGRRAHVAYALPASNTSTTPLTRYRVDPRAHIALRRILRRLEPPLSILGIYHSHPCGPGGPSLSDIREAHVREWVHVIVDLSCGRPRQSAWMIQNGQAQRRALAR